MLCRIDSDVTLGRVISSSRVLCQTAARSVASVAQVDLSHNGVDYNQVNHPFEFKPVNTILDILPSKVPASAKGIVVTILLASNITSDGLSCRFGNHGDFPATKDGDNVLC